MIPTQQQTDFASIGQSAQLIKLMLADLLDESQGLPLSVQQQLYRAKNSVEAYEELVRMEVYKLNGVR